MELFYRDWIVDDAKGTVLLIHGTAEHSGRYEHVAEYLIGRGFNVVTGDLPGWGRSPGLKGHIDSFQEYLDAVEAWLSLAITKLPSHLPLFILGHSLGGLVATRFVQEYKYKERLAGLVLSSPCLYLKVEVPSWKKALADVLDKIWPKLRMGNDIAPYQVTRDPQMQVKYQNDPLNYKKVSVRWFQELQREMKNAQANSQKINLPTLVLQAGSDCLIDPQGVENFVNQVPSSDKKLISFPGLFHEVFNEPERNEVLAELGNWLDVQVTHQ